MPLLDHFHPPLSRTHPWRSFHGAWAAAMARLLNASVLPPGYYATPFLGREGPVEIDVATLHDSSSEHESGERVILPNWTPPSPSQTVAVQWQGMEDVRVEVYSDEGDPRLAASVELVSPRNKDRPQAREAFASKCADLLRQGCGLVVVDAVTTRRAELHADLLTALAVDDARESFGSKIAIAYRSVGREESGRLQFWSQPLEIGKALPTLPLWLGAESAVPLDLEASYLATCTDLRIPQAG